MKDFINLILRFQFQLKIRWSPAFKIYKKFHSLRSYNGGPLKWSPLYTNMCVSKYIRLVRALIEHFHCKHIISTVYSQEENTNSSTLTRYNITVYKSGIVAYLYLNPNNMNQITIINYHLSVWTSKVWQENLRALQLILRAIHTQINNLELLLNKTAKATYISP